MQKLPGRKAGVWQMDKDYSPLNHTHLNEQTYKVLREKLLRRDLAPREKISVEEVAQALGVSRTPVVVALQQLANDGLVEIVPRRGTFVTELTVRDVAELSDMRLMIELYAAERILENGEAEAFLAHIQDALGGMERAMVDDDYGDYEAFIACDRDLHLELVRRAGNEHLLRVYSQMNVHMQIARAHYMDSVEKARQACHEHEMLVQAFRKRDLAGVRQALRAHIGTVKARMLEILERAGGRL